MTEQERIEGINSEQLATATDRLLFASRFGGVRPSSPRFARGSSPRLDNETVFTRRPKHHKRTWNAFTTTALAASFASVATAIALLV